MINCTKLLEIRLPTFFNGNSTTASGLRWWYRDINRSLSQSSTVLSRGCLNSMAILRQSTIFFFAFCNFHKANRAVIDFVPTFLNLYGAYQSSINAVRSKFHQIPYSWYRPRRRFSIHSIDTIEICFTRKKISDRIIQSKDRIAAWMRYWKKFAIFRGNEISFNQGL